MIRDTTPIVIPKILRNVSFSWKQIAATIDAIIVLPPFINVNKIERGIEIPIIIVERESFKNKNKW